MSDERSAGGTKYVKGHHEETVLHRRANLGFGSTSFLLALGLPACFLPLNNPHLQNSQLQCHVIHDKPTCFLNNNYSENLDKKLNSLDQHARVLNRGIPHLASCTMDFELKQSFVFLQKKNLYTALYTKNTEKREREPKFPTHQNIIEFVDEEFLG
jgi:hypothetical protein